MDEVSIVRIDGAVFAYSTPEVAYAVYQEWSALRDCEIWIQLPVEDHAPVSA